MGQSIVDDRFLYNIIIMCMSMYIRIYICLVDYICIYTQHIMRVSEVKGLPKSPWLFQY